jgi:DNA-directed RNA polymerase specialized sigma24 family protein
MIAGNYSALTAYFRRRIAQPAEAEDLVQEAYRKLRKLKSATGPYNAGRSHA